MEPLQHFLHYKHGQRGDEKRTNSLQILMKEGDLTFSETDPASLMIWQEHRRPSKN